MEKNLNGIKGQALALQQLLIGAVENSTDPNSLSPPARLVRLLCVSLDLSLPIIITFIALFKSWGFNFPSHQNESAFNNPTPFCLLFCSPRLVHPHHVREPVLQSGGLSRPQGVGLSLIYDSLSSAC